MTEDEKERYELVMARIGEIPLEERVPEPFRACFADMADFLLMADKTAGQLKSGECEGWSLAEWEALNTRLYADILPGHYEESFANPVYASHLLGPEFGPYLAAFYAQLRAAIVFAFEGRQTEFTILAETLAQLYGQFAFEPPTPRDIEETLCSFHSDYADMTIPGRLREQLDPKAGIAKDIILKSDLNDLRYLYRFGDYISENETGIASYLNSLPQETIDSMASTFTEGFRRGFAVMGRDLSKKSTVMIRYELGFERVVRAATGQFKAMGLDVIITRAAVWQATKNSPRKIGFHAASPNEQYDYDHRFDEAVFYSKAFRERKLAILSASYEKMKDLAAAYAGPAVIETFGQEPFHPENHKEALSLSKRQVELENSYTAESGALADRYIPEAETSFTIISFPVPAVGEPYPAIFEDIIRVNTLDNALFTKIQQAIIDVLDQGVRVHVTGRGGNETDLWVSLHPLEDEKRQTNFENCVADVNIPAGEVFTSPLLSGTCGLLHVKKVCIDNILYRDLRITFTDGFVSDFSCGNFADPEEGRALIRQEILKNHETLPMGEFAIGTNTTAYAVGVKYGISDKLPILIAEKTGPHFALGDTCYSRSEDEPMFNLNGKEVIARDNEISLLRKSEPEKAYFGCHTDITIPYRELGDVTALRADGREIPVLKEGRFVVPGTEKLNEWLT